jgi:hypothetical protein
MVICPLILTIQQEYYADGGACLGEDCGFWSPRVGRCAIGVLGDVADRIGGMK